MVSIRVLIAEDHGVVREAITALLDRYPDIDVVGGADDGRKAVELSARLRPDVILMDVAMPGLNGVDATAQIRRLQPTVKVLMLSGYGDEERVVEAMQAGASGYIIKRSDSDELLIAIKSVYRGNTYFSSELAVDGGGKALMTRARGGGPSESLTPREREVLQLVAEGYSSQQIADRLVISLKTVEVHRSNIMSKIKAKNRTDVVRYALRAGIVELEPPARADAAPA
ncbi:MAG: response regulator [Dehalococcoidia bacterium]|nr:response regulator [Dehalococcoidia bacterium]